MLLVLAVCHRIRTEYHPRAYMYLLIRRHSAIKRVAHKSPKLWSERLLDGCSLPQNRNTPGCITVCSVPRRKRSKHMRNYACFRQRTNFPDATGASMTIAIVHDNEMGFQTTARPLNGHIPGNEVPPLADHGDGSQKLRSRANGSAVCILISRYVELGSSAESC